MSNGNKTLELLNYINTPLSKESISLIYTTHNIKYEKCELFGDFIQSLILLIFDTYMGDNITYKREQINHFKWCWDKNIENFKKEGIGIADIKLYNYFLEFMKEVYYPMREKEKNEKAHSNIIKLWVYIFDYNNNKSKSDMDTFIEVYKLFENSIIVN
jgi:hypothetical protein